MKHVAGIASAADRRQ